MSEKLQAALGELQAGMAEIDEKRRSALITEARLQYARASDDDIEIDDNAVISESDDGAWVQAWVYVRNEDLASDEEGAARQRAEERKDDPKPAYGTQAWAETYSDDLGESNDY